MKKYSESQMLAALNSVMKDRMPGYNASVLHGVLPSASKNRLSGCISHGKKLGPMSYLTSKQEKELSDHMILRHSQDM